MSVVSARPTPPAQPQRPPGPGSALFDMTAAVPAAAAPARARFRARHRTVEGPGGR